MAWWVTAGKVVMAAESFYDFGSGVIGLMSSGEVGAEGVRRLWWTHMARTICRHDLSLDEWRLAMEPTVKAVVSTLGYLPSWIPPLTKETWRQLRIDGGCPERTDWKEIAISAATILVSLLVAYAISRSED